MWASGAARQAWDPRIHQAAEAWLRLEVETVVTGFRSAGLIFGTRHVQGTRLALVDVAPDRFAIGPRAADLAEAYRCGDDETIGALLGFPSCCREFYAATWAQGTGDTTWQMAREGTDGPLECNILGRWLGLRWVMHLPCSFTCPQSAALGAAHRGLLRAIDRSAVEVIDEVLTWPIEWSALHGAAEIRYPVVKVVTRTGYTTDKRIVQRRGTSYPPEGARGLAFPYSAAEMRTPQENGFPSSTTQDAGHAMILDALRRSPPHGAVLDLGAGNGLLMERIASTFLRPVYGIEVDARKAAKHPGIRCGDVRALETLVNRVDTIVVSQRRFEEIPDLRATVDRLARQVLVYSYDDPRFARVEAC